MKRKAETSNVFRDEQQHDYIDTQQEIVRIHRLEEHGEITMV